MAGSVFSRIQSLFVLQFFLKIASVLLFSSAVGALLGWLLSFEGNPAVGNTAMIGFAISPVGITSLILIPTAFLGIVYLEQACILYVYADASGNVVGSMLRAMAKLPRILQLAAIQISIMIAVTAPFLLVAAATYWLLLSDADINYYLTYWPPKFVWAIGIGSCWPLLSASFIYCSFFVGSCRSLGYCLGTSVPSSRFDAALKSRELARLYGDRCWCGFLFESDAR